MRERDALYARITEINKWMDKAREVGDTTQYQQLMDDRAGVTQRLHEEGLLDSADIRSASHRDYERLAGEVESRNTQTRLGLTAEDRRATPPSETADVPRSQQSVRCNSQPGERRSEHEPTTPSGVPQGLPVEQTSASELVSAKINRRREREGYPERLQLAEVQHARLPAALRDYLHSLEALTGTKVRVVRNLTPEVDRFNGVTFRKGVLYVDDTSQSPVTTAAAHESSHQLTHRKGIARGAALRADELGKRQRATSSSDAPWRGVFSVWPGPRAAAQRIRLPALVAGFRAARWH